MSPSSCVTAPLNSKENSHLENGFSVTLVQVRTKEKVSDLSSDGQRSEWMWPSLERSVLHRGRGAQRSWS